MFASIHKQAYLTCLKRTVYDLSEFIFICGLVLSPQHHDHSVGQSTGAALHHWKKKKQSRPDGTLEWPHGEGLEEWVDASLPDIFQFCICIRHRNARTNMNNVCLNSLSPEKKKKIWLPLCLTESTGMLPSIGDYSRSFFLH